VKNETLQSKDEPIVFGIGKASMRRRSAMDHHSFQSVGGAGHVTAEMDSDCCMHFYLVAPEGFGILSY
jgi:hypothetical protein